MPRSKVTWRSVPAAALWLALAGGGLWLLQAYQGAPGARAPSPTCWPGDSRVLHRPGGFHLVLFAHPRCPCTRATVGELARTVARGGRPLAVDVLFFRPHQGVAAWPRTELWRWAAAIPGARVGWDEGGVEARRFGARTSGHVVVYDAGGNLRFSGGITGARGHEGDNPGSDAVVALLRGEGRERQDPPVFGCPLEAPCELCQEARP